jgi:hypothetical protein
MCGKASIQEVTLAEPWNKDMNIGYCDLMLYTFCTLIGTLYRCIVILSLLCYFVLCAQASMDNNKQISNEQAV